MRKLVNFVHLINGLVVAGEFFKIIFNLKLMQNSILLSFFGIQDKGGGRQEATHSTFVCLIKDLESWKSGMNVPD